jgi:tRNA modification GTPase
LKEQENKMYIDDTIAAIVTAPGEAGVGIIRVSGRDALECVNRIFEPARPGVRLEEKVRYMTLGHIVDRSDASQKKNVDEVLCVYMKAPYTYTREDVVEINCHGGYLSLRKTLELVLKNGARLAERGEYTKRAFLNGRIDLSQAEAVMDIITAKTGKSHELSQRQLEGKLSGKLSEIRHSVTADLARITVAVDFPEEDEPEVTYAELIESTQKHLQEIDRMIQSFEAGKIYRDGLRTVIIGKPNVGKSSLLNGILKENRAIVTDIAGTTRDIIEEYLTLDGIPIRLVDTAGIRSTDDVVEKIGVERSKESIENADLVILMLDRSRELDREDIDIIDIAKDKKLIVIINKQDLESRLDEETVRQNLETGSIIHASVINNQGIDELKAMIKHMVEGQGLTADNDYMINNVRHKNALERAAKACEDALESLSAELPLDIIETDFKNIWDYLGEITGDTTSETLLDTIFANFCIGK